MIEETDRQIGRLLQWVESNATDRPTIVVFTSDHGDMACQLGLCDELFGPYGSAMHVPAILAMPCRLPPGATVDSFTQHSDLMPTVLDLLDIRIPAEVKGYSLVVLAHGGAPVRDRVICGREVGEVSQMISDGRFTLIEHPGLDGEFYDLQADPQQIVNLWSDPLHAADRDRLSLELAVWRASACQ